MESIEDIEELKSNLASKDKIIDSQNEEISALHKAYTTTKKCSVSSHWNSPTLMKKLTTSKRNTVHSKTKTQKPKGNFTKTLNVPLYIV